MLLDYIYGYTALLVFLFLLLLNRTWHRLLLSRAKHPSLRGHSKWSRRIARLVPYFDYGDIGFLCSDNAPTEIVRNRQRAIDRLKEHFQTRQSKSIQLTRELESSISDIHFTQTYRVPFPYREPINRMFKSSSFAVETSGVMVRDIDDNWSYDLTGSYGVNLFGYDFYKECMDEAWELVRDLGPLLGHYHPLIEENVEQLKKISGLDEVSFHMSGTEAVMQAVRLARYHTGKSHLVRFCGAYHGWWDGVQPGIGNSRNVDDVYTLRDMSDITLKVLKTRKDIACVLVNPLQALHPNSDAPSDASLVNAARSADFDRKVYADWLARLREVCSERKIVLIFDEVFTGFRLGYRGAQEYFNIQADIVTYGKTLGGGMPVGVVCGRHDLMKRFRDDQPANISFARGTFNSHPYVMATMNIFLKRIESPVIQSQYQVSGSVWQSRLQLLNERLQHEQLPVRVAGLLSIWTVLYTRPSRYNWMFQFYLRANGLSLSWIGSGRLIFSHNYNDQDFERVVDSFVSAARAMQEDGWWWTAPQQTNRSVQKQIMLDMLVAKMPLLKKLTSNRHQSCSVGTVNQVH